MTVFANADELLARLQLLSEVANMGPLNGEEEHVVATNARDYLNDRLRASAEYRRVGLGQVEVLRRDRDTIATMVKMHEQALVALVYSMQRSLMDLCLMAEPEAAHAVVLGIPSDDPGTGVMAPFHKREFEGGELQAPCLPKFLANMDDMGWE